MASSRVVGNSAAVPSAAACRRPAPTAPWRSARWLGPWICRWRPRATRSRSRRSATRARRPCADPAVGALDALGVADDTFHHWHADEPFSLDALARYQLQDEAVRNAQRGSDHAADPLAWTRAKGVLPVGAHGAATFHALQSDTQQLMDEAHRYAKTTVRKIDLKLDSIQIVGSIEGFGEEDLVYMRGSKLKPKDQMRAWLMHLIVALQRIQDGDQAETPWPTTTRVLTSSDTNAYSEVPEDVAREHLLRLLSLREEGLTRPLPFFEKCSHAVGTALHKGKDESTALRQGIKDYSEWPTIPQLYIKGEFVGGADYEFHSRRASENNQLA